MWLNISAGHSLNLEKTLLTDSVDMRQQSLTPFFTYPPERSRILAEAFIQSALRKVYYKWALRMQISTFTAAAGFPDRPRTRSRSALFRGKLGGGGATDLSGKNCVLESWKRRRSSPAAAKSPKPKAQFQHHAYLLLLSSLCASLQNGSPIWGSVCV